MKLTSEQVLVWPGDIIKKTNSGIHIPISLQKTDQWGVVVSAGKATNLKKGDVVFFYIQAPWDVDGETKKAINYEGKLHYLMDHAYIQGVSQNKKLTLKITENMGAGKFEYDIDFTKDVKPLKKNVFIQLLKQNRTKSGLIIPETKSKKGEYKKGIVLNMADASLSAYYDKDEIQVGDIVLLPSRHPGGYLLGNDEIIRTNATAILAKLNKETAEWHPVGGRIMFDAIRKGLRMETNEHGETTWVNNKGLAIPLDADIPTSVVRVTKKGGGWSDDFTSAKMADTSGPIPFSIGAYLLAYKVMVGGKLGPSVHRIDSRDLKKGDVKQKPTFIADWGIIDAEVTSPDLISIISIDDQGNIPNYVLESSVKNRK